MTGRRSDRESNPRNYPTAMRCSKSVCVIVFLQRASEGPESVAEHSSRGECCNHAWLQASGIKGAVGGGLTLALVLCGRLFKVPGNSLCTLAAASTKGAVYNISMLNHLIYYAMQISRDLP